MVNDTQVLRTCEIANNKNGKVNNYEHGANPYQITFIAQSNEANEKLRLLYAWFYNHTYA